MSLLWFGAGIAARGCSLDEMLSRAQEREPLGPRDLPADGSADLGLSSFFADAMRVPRGPHPGDPVSDAWNVDDINVMPFRTVGMGPEPVRRALRLLARVVDPRQRRELVMFGHFSVRSPRHGEYLILPRSVFNVVELESGASYCAGPLTPLPIPDLMLLQKLMLENEPEKFFQVANRRQPDVALRPRNLEA
ncbi:MAG TPA: hypothetical protein VHB46_11070 [Burkholderiales bacterium]|nr:hypothetical protein [Burkholderiales bacterium]